MCLAFEERGNTVTTQLIIKYKIVPPITIFTTTQYYTSFCMRNKHVIILTCALPVPSEAHSNTSSIVLATSACLPGFFHDQQVFKIHLISCRYYFLNKSNKIDLSIDDVCVLQFYAIEALLSRHGVMASILMMRWLCCYASCTPQKRARESKRHGVETVRDKFCCHWLVQTSSRGPKSL